MLKNVFVWEITYAQILLSFTIIQNTERSLQIALLLLIKNVMQCVLSYIKRDRSFNTEKFFSVKCKLVDTLH